MISDELRPKSASVMALPWAVFSSAMEWFVLVPLFPFWQPLFTLKQPYLDRPSRSLLVPRYVLAVCAAALASTTDPDARLYRKGKARR
jgi:hypothetical protein